MIAVTVDLLPSYTTCLDKPRDLELAQIGNYYIQISKKPTESYQYIWFLYIGCDVVEHCMVYPEYAMRARLRPFSRQTCKMAFTSTILTNTLYVAQYSVRELP